MPADALRQLPRSTWEALRYYLAGLWKRLNEMPVPIWAQAIAFKVLVTILPLILIATGVFGLVLRAENPFEAVAGYLRTFLPPGQSEGLITLLSRLQEASGTITILGSVFLVGAVITLFGTLRYIVGTAMGQHRHTARSILGGYLFDARMALQVGLLFLLSFGLTFGVNYLTTTGVEVLVGWGFDPDLLARGTVLILRAATLLVPFLISVAMFAQLFYFIPRPSPPSRSAFFGAFFTAILFDLAKNAFTLYATYTGRFEAYTTGEGDALGGLGGVFGLLLAFVFWVYFSGLVLIVGAIMTYLHEQRHQPERSRLRRFLNRLVDKHRREAERQREQGPSVEPAAQPAAGP